LKFEVWDGTNDEFIDRTIAVIAAIVRKLDNGHLDWQSLDTRLAQFVIAASTECSQRLHDSKQQHVLGSGQILRAMGSGSHLAFDLIIRNVLPRMFLMWDDENYREKKILLLDVFNQILRARLDLRDGTIFAAANPFQDPNIVQRPMKTQ
jgi:DNA repair/transcription protein MET18/MMS19